MYQALLTRRYLTSKIMPWLATIAVAVCCFLMLTAWSVMGGFLNVFMDIGRKLEGDVTITWPTSGFPYYDDLIARLEKDDAIAAAAPMIRTFGMISLPDDRAFGVTIQGIDERFAKVSDYADSLYWKPIGTPNPKDAQAEDPRLVSGWPNAMERDLRNAGPIDGRSVEPPPVGSFRSWEETYQDGLRLMEPDLRTGEMKPAAVLGIELGGFSQRQPGGWYKVPAVAAARRADGNNKWSAAFMPARHVTITVLPMDQTGRDISTKSMRMPVANEFRAGLFDVDKNNLFVHISALQKMLKMEAGEQVESGAINPYAIEETPDGDAPAKPRVIASVPAKVTSVVVRARPGFTSEQVRERCLDIYEQFASDHAGQVPTFEQMLQSKGISTWERNLGMFIGQVKRETITVLLMLTIISLVCSVLILAIFWSMVSEKTKDIGILRSIGCSKTGVAWLWLRYGLAIGVSGAALGLLAACGIVWNINEIHDWLGRAMGIAVWDPSVYYLPDIPNKVEWTKAAIVAGGGLGFSVLGALIPAMRAATMDPVRALRFE